MSSTDDNMAEGLPKNNNGQEYDEKNDGDENGQQVKSFRRAKSRASRACEVCHARKVRCDVTVHMPCTNCAAFGIECKIPDVKQRKSSKNPVEKKKKDNTETPTNGKPTSESAMPKSTTTTIMQYPSDRVGRKDSSTPSSDSGSKNMNHLVDSKVNGPGNVAFLGSTSNLNLLFEDSTNESVHYSLPEGSPSSSRLNRMDKEEIEILKIRGAFLLPARELCDDIVEAYFEKIHPIVPMINRARFMRQYSDPKNRPSLLLLQAVLLAGSRVCNNPGLLDANGSGILASETFYKRAKALFDAGYETDRISIIQSTVLIGWYSENPDDVTKNLFYWTRIALGIGQSIGLHRSVEDSSMGEIDKRMWKRIFWTLFARDRMLATALGRPLMINLDDADVPPLTEEDFDEDELGLPSPYPYNRLHVLYFIQSVKLCEIMGLVLRNQFSIGAEHFRRQNKVPTVNICDMAMAQWMNNLPPELKYSAKDKQNHEFFKALLHVQYYTVLCLVHRSNVLQKRTSKANSASYPSWGIAFQAAHMIAKIVENMNTFHETKNCPAFVLYSIFSAMIILLYQTESTSKDVVESAQKALENCVMALEEMGEIYGVAKMIIKLFNFMSENQSIKQKIISSAKKFSVPSKAKHKRQLEQQHNPEPKRPNVKAGGQFPSTYDQQKFNGTSNPQQSMTSPVGNMMSIKLPPDLFLVTNSTPAGIAEASSFFEDFQPSQLFPEAQDNNNLTFHSGLSSSSGPSPDHQLAAELASNNSSSPGESIHGDIPQMPPRNNTNNININMTNDINGPVRDAPTSLNIGEWYQFLANNSENQPGELSFYEMFGTSSLSNIENFPKY